jgi:TPR repeat protein
MLLGDIYSAMENPADAYLHYKNATKSSHSEAHWKICELYVKSGQLEHALTWNKRAVDVNGLWGKTKHVRRIAECYRDGVGVEPNEEESLVWFKKLASFGDTEALYYLAQTSFERDDFLAGVRLLVSASKKGHEESSDKFEEIKDFITELFSTHTLKRKREEEEE